MEIAPRRNGTQNRLLAAASRPEALSHVALHAIMLAKRTDMRVNLLLVLPEQAKNRAAQQEEGRTAFREIRREGEQQGVSIDCRTIAGSFVEEVVRCLTELESPILIVGEGEDLQKRRRELLTIRKRIEQGPGRRGGGILHYLIVTKRNKAITPGGDKPAGHQSTTAL